MKIINFLAFEKECCDWQKWSLFAYWFFSKVSLNVESALELRIPLLYIKGECLGWWVWMN